jgi:hypothetical protein
MFQPRWREDLMNDLHNQSMLIELKIKERIAEEVARGFDTRDEMKEVFLEIADEFNVGPNVVWGIYREGEW